MRISDWSSDVCSSDLRYAARNPARSADGAGDDVRAVARRGRGARGQGLGLGIATPRRRQPAVLQPAAQLRRADVPGRAGGGDVVEHLAGAGGVDVAGDSGAVARSEEHTSELQSL